MTAPIIRTTKRRFLVAAAAGAVLAAILMDYEVPGIPLPEPSTVEAPPPQAASCDTLIEPMSERQRVAQLVMVGVPGDVEAATKLVTDNQVGGIFVHSNPIQLLVEDRLAKVKAAAQLPLTVSIDEEGGRVQTVDPLAGSIPSAREMAATMSPEKVKAKAVDRGKFLSRMGVNMNLAPITDVSSQPDNTVIGDRSFSSDPATVKRYAAAFAAGLSETGVYPVIKHFPGHGNTTGDSHKTTVVTAPLAQLTTLDLVPYQRLTDYGKAGVMLGHLVVPDLTGNEPATVSPAAYKLLREQFGFDGLAMTDDLGAMRAISDRYDLPEAVLRAITAGADMALWSSGGRVAEVLNRLEQAARSGELPAQRLHDALRHVLVSKGLC